MLVPSGQFFASERQRVGKIPAIKNCRQCGMKTGNERQTIDAIYWIQVGVIIVYPYICSGGYSPT